MTGDEGQTAMNDFLRLMRRGQIAAQQAAQQEAAQQAGYAAMAKQGAAMMATPSPPPPPPPLPTTTNTNCNTFGNTINCRSTTQP
jgi:hypothetical protein